jgi:hypothetical protein
MTTPEQINKELSSRPPMQRDEAGKHYEGIKVVWILKFRQCFYPDSQNKTLLTIHGMSGNADVALQVSPDQYPELKVLHAGENFKVRGTISEIQHGHLIVLKDVYLNFDIIEEPKKSNKVETPSSPATINVAGDFVARDKFEQNGNQNKMTVGPGKEKEWYETWWGIILITVLAGILIVAVTNLLGLSKA